MEHNVHADFLVSTSGVKVLGMNSGLKLALVCKVLGHVSGKDVAYHLGSDLLIVSFVKVLEYVILFLLDECKGGGHMMVFKHRYIIVLDSNIISSFHEICIVYSRMLVIMTGSSNQHGGKLQVIQPCLLEELATSGVVVSSTAHICSMRLVVVGNILVSILDFCNEGHEGFHTDLQALEQTMLMQQVSSHSYQLVFLCCFPNCENIKVKSLA